MTDTGKRPINGKDVDISSMSVAEINQALIDVQNRIDFHPEHEWNQGKMKVSVGTDKIPNIRTLVRLKVKKKEFFEELKIRTHRKRIEDNIPLVARDYISNKIIKYLKDNRFETYG